MFKLLPPANEVWGKVMFLQASVILLIRGGVSAPGVSAPRGVSALGEGVCSRGGG